MFTLISTFKFPKESSLFNITVWESSSVYKFVDMLWVLLFVQDSAFEYNFSKYFPSNDESFSYKKFTIILYICGHLHVSLVVIN